LEKVGIPLDGLPLGALQIDGEVKSRPVHSGDASPNAANKGATKLSNAIATTSPQPKKEDGKW
jgi:hypothetical protein